MSIPGWIGKRPEVIREHGFRQGVSRSVMDVALYALMNLDGLDPRGTPVYEKDWDVLILLDGCRVDLMEEIADEYDFVPKSFPTIRSEASASRTWMERNFIDRYYEQMGNTAYVTGNPHSERHLDSSKFQLVDEVWRYGWDDQLGTIPPRHVTERAIATGRNSEQEKMIVHYMQPHFPSIPDPLDSAIDLEKFGEGWDSIWNRLDDGQIDYETVWNSYRENLKYVLNDVELLLQNLEAETIVISSDHGNAFGELNIYGHPPRIPITVLREVPWIKTEGVDNGGYTPELSRDGSSIQNEEVRERLVDLGYV